MTKKRKYIGIIIVVLTLLFAGWYYRQSSAWVRNIPLIGFSQKEEEALRTVLVTLHKRCRALEALELIFIRRDSIDAPMAYGEKADGVSASNVHLSLQEIIMMPAKEFQERAYPDHIRKQSEHTLTYDFTALEFKKDRSDGMDVIEIFNLPTRITTAKASIDHFPDGLSFSLEGLVAHELGHALYHDFPREAVWLSQSFMLTQDLCIEAYGGDIRPSQGWVSEYPGRAAVHWSLKNQHMTSALDQLYGAQGTPLDGREKFIQFFKWLATEEAVAEALCYLLTNQQYNVSPYASMQLKDGRRYLERINALSR